MRMRNLRRLRPTKRRIAVALGATGIAVAGFIAAAAVHADNPSGCDFAPNGTTLSCVGPLTGSTFAGGDGNLLTNPTTFGTTDWQNVAGRNVGIDQPSGQSDNSFGQGTKEDNPAVTIVTGSIPPNKSDLSRFYEASETVSGQTFLYLAWERTNSLGNANMDFEIDQKATSGFGGSTLGSITLNRQPGDLLVTFDFTNGGGRPVLGLNRWLTSATNPSVPGFTTNTCLSSSSFPCWGDNVVLNSGDSEGAVNNSDAVTDPVSNSSIGQNEFGETAINLTAAGVFGTNSCTTFATTFLKSRSSSAFNAEVKDFVAPVPTSITNCGEVKIVKHTDPSGINQNFGYTSTLAGGQLSCTTDTTPSAFTLNAATNDTEDCTNVPFGNYTVTESLAANFVLESLTCSSGGSQDATNPLQADIGLTATNSPITCTYLNKQQLGALKITKTSSKAAATPLAGATFTVTDSSGTAITGSPFTTGSDGTFCVSGVAFGTYTVTETAAPTGYQIDNPNGVGVTVNANGTCTSGSQATHTFTDTPLTDIGATARSEVTGGTQSTISCTDANGKDVGTSPQGPSGAPSVSANGLLPGTYTCTIVIDP